MFTFLFSFCHVFCSISKCIWILVLRIYLELNSVNFFCVFYFLCICLFVVDLSVCYLVHFSFCSFMTVSERERASSGVAASLVWQLRNVAPSSQTLAHLMGIHTSCKCFETNHFRISASSNSFSSTCYYVSLIPFSLPPRYILFTWTSQTIF